eukprot:SAG11_NODE_2997_length_2781_cov_2.921700_3_plen_99_part_00
MDTFLDSMTLSAEEAAKVEKITHGELHHLKVPSPPPHNATSPQCRTYLNTPDGARAMLPPTAALMHSPASVRFLGVFNTGYATLPSDAARPYAIPRCF